MDEANVPPSPLPSAGDAIAAMSHPEALAISSEHKLRSENLAFDIDVWYPMLMRNGNSTNTTPTTFPSLFIPLRIQEAKAIVSYYKTRFNLKRSSDFGVADIGPLQELEERIDSALSNPMFSGNGAFMRLCGRSPKDADPLNRSRVWESYLQHLSDICEYDGTTSEPTVHQKIRAMARTPLLHVRSSQDVLNLLLTSERVYADMIDWIDYGEPEQIVLREWRTLSIEYEFRAYINNGNLNAISQYDHYGVYPHLTNIKDHLQQLLVQQWKLVHPLVGISSYCIDFVYSPETDSVQVVELSPFLPCTGAALFSWKGPDGEILRNGPFEFRLNETAKHGDVYLSRLVQMNWEERWQNESVPYWKLFPEQYWSHYEQSNPESLVDTLLKFGSSLFSSLNSTVTPASPPLTHLLFVYGTLKLGFHWNYKYLWNAKFRSSAETIDHYPLVVGHSGVPYVLGDCIGQGHKVTGELWSVDSDTLQSLDEYEGVSKGYYSRIRIQAIPRDSNETPQTCVTAFMYVNISSTPSLRLLKPIPEYTLEIHRSQYKAIEHILVKQELYLGISHGDNH